MIYLDTVATTPVLKEVKDAIYSAMDLYCNPSSLYNSAVMVKKNIQDARKTIASYINAEPEEIIFTASGSEANNLAIKGYQLAHPETKILCSTIEHKSVLATVNKTNKQENNFVIGVDGFGLIRTDLLDQKTSPNDLVSIMFANNEIGTIQNIKIISEIVHKNGGIFHTDAVQAFGKIPIDVKDLGIDMMSVAGHKIGCPKGIGFLYKKKNIQINPIIDGGGQENGLRAGTENTPYIIGFKTAIECLQKKEYKPTNFKDILTNSILDEVQDVKINSPIESLTNILNVSFKGVSGEAIMLLLNMKNICISTASACNSNQLTSSHVLKAIGATEDYINGTIRISWDANTNEDEIELFIKSLVEIVQVLRMKKLR